MVTSRFPSNIIDSTLSDNEVINHYDPIQDDECDMANGCHYVMNKTYV